MCSEIPKININLNNVKNWKCSGTGTRIEELELELKNWKKGSRISRLTTKFE